MPTLEDNRFWDTYDWSQHGDEWADQAEFCGMPYSVWKGDLVEAFIVPNVTQDSTVLEVAVGHGRWTPFLAQRARRYIGADLNPSCVSFCRERFAHLTNTEFHVTDGRTLPFIASGSVQFVWSYDSFVHIDVDVTEAYMAEFARILSVGGRCSIHHPGHPSREQRVRGGRSDVTTEVFAHIAESCGLRVISQVDSWGPGNRSNARLAADCISSIEKPPSSLPLR